MSNSTLVNPQSLMDTLSIHTEMAKGAIKITPNPKDHGLQPASFTDLMESKIAAVNLDQNISGGMMRAVDSGASDDLVGAMVASQKASLSFSAMVQIRNRLVQAFDEVMKMPL